MNVDAYLASIIAAHEAAGSSPRDIQWHGHLLRVLPFVFSPALAESSVFLVDYLLQQDVRDAEVIDAGCGTGILGIACALAGARRILAFDQSPLAIDNTKQNVQRLGLTKKFEFSVALDWEPRFAQCDIVVCNPPFVDASPSTDWHRMFLDPHRQFLRAVLHNAWTSMASTGRLIVACADEVLPSLEVFELIQKTGFRHIKRQEKANDSLLKVVVVSACKS